MQVLAEKTLFKNHSGGVGYWNIKAIGGAEPGLLITFAKKMDGKPVEQFSPTEAKNVGRSNETSPESQALLELDARWLKQQDKGYVQTLEAANDPVTNTLGKKKPMLAQPAEKIKAEDVDWATAYLQPKLDGNRGLREDIMYSRSGNEFVNLDHLNSPIVGTPLENLHLDGEIYTHGVPLPKITGFIKKLQAGTQELAYWFYDVVDDAPFSERFAMLKAAFDATPAHPLLILTPTIKVNSWAEVEVANQENILKGFEGSILRWGEEGYEDDTRSIHLVKIKPFQDTEFKVIGCTFGKPNKGPNGEKWDNPIFHYEIKPGLVSKVVAPGTHAEKHEQGVNFEQYIDKLMTIKHMGYSPKGVPVIATAKCWYQPL